jgi:ATP-dependent RNA helicase DeaD
MGREGVAFTFVAPEEGPELTRIEMRIERLLKRDEMDGFDGGPHMPPPEGDAGNDRVESEKPEPPAPLFGRRGRAPKRYRRAL